VVADSAILGPRAGSIFSWTGGGAQRGNDVHRGRINVCGASRRRRRRSGVRRLHGHGRPWSAVRAPIRVELPSADGGASGERVRAKRPGEVRARPSASAGAEPGGGDAAEGPITAAPPP